MYIVKIIGGKTEERKAVRALSQGKFSRDTYLFENPGQCVSSMHTPGMQLVCIGTSWGDQPAPKSKLFFICDDGTAEGRFI